MTDNDIHRPLYVCQDPDCGVRYLPPGSMEYPSGPASEVYCSDCAPKYSPAEAARPGLDLSLNVIKPRSQRPRRAGSHPVKRGSVGRGKLA